MRRILFRPVSTMSSCLLVFFFAVVVALAAGLTILPGSSPSEKAGRCPRQHASCSRPSPNSKCFFHAECFGNQLCCSADGCGNTCIDPLKDNLTEPSTDGYFTCRNGWRIKGVYHCNGQKECPDGSDEFDCPCTEQQTMCTSGLCMDINALCYPLSPGGAVCDVPYLDCASLPCSNDTSFRCGSSQCIPKTNRCDGVFNCNDGSDEANCVCPAGSFVCDGGLCKSVLNTWCNGIVDCLDGQDEAFNCTCKPGQFHCGNGRCIPEYLQCDSKDDCLDGSDEINCSLLSQGDFVPANHPELVSARGGSIPSCSRRDSFSCGGTCANFCVPMSNWCDRVSDCQNQSDEPQNCSNTCPASAFQCDGSRCVSQHRRCDGRTDCRDKSDEEACQCAADQMPLPVSGCLNHELFGNGVADAADGQDEEFFTCKDRLQMSQPEKLCDGILDCIDSSDELSCGNCSVSQFYCMRSQQCVARNQTCDGLLDCSYGEDEEDCLGMVPSCNITADMTVQLAAAGCLAVNNRGEWMPVCAERWSSSLSDAICEIEGYDKSTVTNLINMEPTEGVTDVPSRTPRAIEGPQIIITAARSCPSRKKVYIECGTLRCGQRSSVYGPPRVENSTEAAVGKYPWLASLYKEGVMMCTGALVDQHWVLTSAQCMIDLQDGHVIARLGSTRRSSTNPNEQFVLVDYMVAHPSFNLVSAEADLAFLHLSSPAQWSKSVQPSCLPSVNSSISGDVTVASWSRELGGRLSLAEDNLQEMNVPLFNRSWCQGNPLVPASVGDSTFCGNLTQPVGGKCYINRGGPAFGKDYFERWNIVGVTSFAIGCATRHAVAGFTNVSRYADWIAATISDDNFTRLDVSHTACPGGARCEIGTCINPSQMCDGVVDCPLTGSDEANCSASSPTTSPSMSINCTFDDRSLCGYRQDLTDKLNWKRGHVVDNSTMFPSVGLKFTAVPYIYLSSLQTKVNGTDNQGRLISPKIPPLTGQKCLTVSYYAVNSQLLIYDFLDNKRLFGTFAEVSGNQTSGWVAQQVSVPLETTSFVMEGRLQPPVGHFSMVAVQSVDLTPGVCGMPVERTVVHY
ncbi:hypothetical protein RvY_18566 [Ramazzottius varieornatus]|uniref:Peptidase S1 domain-containing protein n=1 Tax=Ramazzottius varieornatus TaxID=947166 RepID=A0A1D1W682_RAMVA|nr:hypothetical protein RvY_18566 [Ramazzottius varieornatus]